MARAADATAMRLKQSRSGTPSETGRSKRERPRFRGAPLLRNATWAYCFGAFAGAVPAGAFGFAGAVVRAGAFERALSSFML